MLLKKPLSALVVHSTMFHVLQDLIKTNLRSENTRLLLLTLYFDYLHFLSAIPEGKLLEVRDYVCPVFLVLWLYLHFTHVEAFGKSSDLSKVLWHPRQLNGKESDCQCRRHNLSRWERWRTKCHPAPVFLPEKSHGLRSLVGCDWACVCTCAYTHTGIHTHILSKVPNLGMSDFLCSSASPLGLQIIWPYWYENSFLKKKKRKFPFGHNSQPVGSLVPLPGIESRPLAMQESLPLDHQGIDKFSS